MPRQPRATLPRALVLAASRAPSASRPPSPLQRGARHSAGSTGSYLLWSSGRRSCTCTFAVGSRDRRSDALRATTHGLTGRPIGRTTPSRPPPVDRHEHGRIVPRGVERRLSAVEARASPRLCRQVIILGVDRFQFVIGARGCRLPALARSCARLANALPRVRSYPSELPDVVM